jgi:hypothetical protein
MPWYQVALPRSRSLAFADRVLFAQDGAGPPGLTGSRAEGGRIVDGDAALPGSARSMEVTLRSGDRLFPPPGRDIPANHWLVALLIYRATAGEAMVQVNGSRGMSGGARLASARWDAVVGLCRPVPSAVAGNSLHLTSDRGATLRLGGMALLAFPALAQALDFANASLFPGGPNAA